MTNFFWSAALVATGILYGQPVQLNPTFLYVGSPGELLFTLPLYPGGLTFLWNGSPRPTSFTAGIGYTMMLTSGDLAFPQLAVATIVDSQTGVALYNRTYPVGYNAQPTGVALDRKRNRLYVATPAATKDPRFPPNSVVVLDLATGVIGPVVQVNSILGDLALSDDGSALYAVVEGDNFVRRLDPETLAAAGDFSFRPPGYKPPYPNAPMHDAITVMPGKPGTVALGFSPDVGSSPIQIAIFDNGLKRPNVISDNCCGSPGILFSPDGNYLFRDGYNGNFITYRYQVNGTGIPTQKAVFAAGGVPGVIAGGTLYTSRATAIDYESMHVTGNFEMDGTIAVDSENQRAFILYSPPVDRLGQSPVRLAAFALPSFQPLGSQVLGLTPASLPNPAQRLLRFGVDGVIISSTDGLLIFHTPLAGPAPSTAKAAIVNAASQQAGAIAPGEILTIYGTNLGPTLPQAGVSDGIGFFPFSLSNVQVWFGRLPGALLLGYQGQINIVAPFSLKPGEMVDMQVWYFGIPSAKISLPVASTSPALFTRTASSSGPVSLINQDGSVNTPSPPGSVVALYGTGGGVMAGAVDGAVARRAASLSAPVRVSIAGRDAQVLYAGAAPGLVSGVFQINVLLPADMPSGTAAIIVNINGQDSPQGATLEIR